MKIVSLYCLFNRELIELNLNQIMTPRIGIVSFPKIATRSEACKPGRQNDQCESHLEEVTSSFCYR